MKYQNSILLVLFAIFFVGCTTQSDENSDFGNPSGPNSQYPHLYNSGESLYMSWISTADDGTHALNYARYADNRWTNPHTIATDSTWFVNWADFPSIIADKNGPVAAHWLDLKNPGPLAYDVNITTFSNNSGDWNETIIPHSDGTSTEHGFVSMVPWDDDTFLAVWLDGRRTANRTGEEYYNLGNAMTLRGALISTGGSIKSSFLIDEAVCDCCPTDLVKTTDGAIVVYRDRTDDEIRDIYVSHFDGNQWSDPEAVHNDGWKVGACPVNGPALAVEDSTVLVSWHTAANDEPATKGAISTDGGHTFGDPIVFNDGQSIGRVDAALRDRQAYISWMESNSDSANLKLASFPIQHSDFSRFTVGTLNDSRSSGFPQMVAFGDQLIFAWTNADSAQNKIKTKSLKLPLSNN